MLPGNASVVAQQNPYGLKASSCDSAPCDAAGGSNRSNLAGVESKAAGSFVQLNDDSNSINPILLPRTFAGTTQQLGKEDLVFDGGGHYQHGATIGGPAGSGSGGFAGGHAQGSGGQYGRGIAINGRAGSGNGGFPGENIQGGGGQSGGGIAINGRAGSGNGGPPGENIQGGGVPHEIASGDPGVTTAAQPPQHPNEQSHCDDAPTRVSDQGNNPVDKFPGIGGGETPGYPPTNSFISPEEVLADYVEPELPLTPPVTDRGNDAPTGNVTTTTVPEPATLALFALGLAGCGVARRSRATPLVSPPASPAPRSA